MASGAVCIAYETVTDKNGRLPLLAPMSKVAGRLAAQAAAHYLQRSAGGCGKLIGGVPGVPPARVCRLRRRRGRKNAARVAYGMGARVTILEKNADVMDAVDADLTRSQNRVFIAGLFRTPCRRRRCGYRRYFWLSAKRRLNHQRKHD